MRATSDAGRQPHPARDLPRRGVLGPEADRLDRLCHWAAYRATTRLRASGFAPDPDDALAGASFGAWRAAQTYDPSRGTSLTTWAYPWIKRYADLEARASAGLTTRGDGLHLYEYRLHEDVRLDTSESVWADRITVRDAVRLLPDSERMVLWLLYWEDQEQRKVAARMSLSRARIRALHDRALDHLRQEIYGMHNCLVCGKPDYRKPMIFKGVPWCSELHHKVVTGELTAEQADDIANDRAQIDTKVMR